MSKYGAPLPLPYPRLHIHSSNCSLLDSSTGKPNIMTFRSVFPLEELRDLKDDLLGNPVVRRYAQEREDSRGPHSTLAVGAWLERGGGGQPHLTPFTKTTEGKQFIQRHRNLFIKASSVAQRVTPWYAADLMCVPEELRLLELFSLGFFNITPGHQCHRDLRDYVFCWVAVFGDFEAGELSFPYLDTIVHVKPGDLICFRSKELFHEVMPATGQRMSFVLCTHTALLNRFR